MVVQKLATLAASERAKCGCWWHPRNECWVWIVRNLNAPAEGVSAAN